MKKKEGKELKETAIYHPYLFLVVVAIPLKEVENKNSLILLRLLITSSLQKGIDMINSMHKSNTYKKRAKNMTSTEHANKFAFLRY